MENSYPNWSLVEYLSWVFGFLGGAIDQPGDFWLKLGCFFMAVLLSVGLVPLSILWFIVKNNGKVGGLTWALLIITPIIGLIWLALA